MSKTRTPISELNIQSTSNNLCRIQQIDYAILSAMPEELEYFENMLANFSYREVKINRMNFKVYDYNNTGILLAHTGMGTTFASSVLTLIFSYFSPEYFFVIGTAGGIKTGLRVRDVVIVEKAFEAEILDAFTLLKNTPFENCLTHPMNNEKLSTHYPADPFLLKLSDSLSLKDINIHKGTVVTSNTFPAPKELFDKIKSLDPYSIDMETSALYQAAWLLNAKILAVRGISNILNSDGSDKKLHESDIKGSSLAASKVLFSILTKLISVNMQNKESMSHKIENEELMLINKYKLQPHPEGGYFSQIYKSADTVKPLDCRYHNEQRSASTSIYYLLEKNDYSAWHRLNSDELWHFYKGSPLSIYVIDKCGTLSSHLLGDPLITSNANFQVCIKAGNYFAAKNTDKSSYSFVSCTVSPGFEYTDFELADKNELIDNFPQHESTIKRFARQM